MRLVGKKLYRTGPLKLFNQNKKISGPSPEQLEKMRKDRERFQMREQLKAEMRDKEKEDWKGEAMRDLYDPEQKALFERRKQLADDVGSGAAARRGAEAGLKAQMAAAGGGRGSAAARMRGLARAGEAGVRGAAAQGAGAAAQQFGMLGQAGQGRFDQMRSDKMGRLGFYQKSRGLDVAEKAAEQQAAATRAANQSTGKASGGEIFKEFKRKNGKIEGPGTETSDSIRAMLSDGEFVVNAKTVRGLGEAMGGEGKEESRKKGAGFLYDLQTKYGDKKPVKKMGGGMMLADLGAHAAKRGLMGKKFQGAGEIASEAVDLKKGFDEKKQKDLKLSKGGVIHHPVKATPQDLLKKKKSGGEIKKDKDKGLSTKEKWNLGLAIGQAAIGARAKALQAEKDRKHKLAEGLRESYKTLAQAGNALIGSGVALKDGGWIQSAVKKPGALRAVAKKDKLIKGDEKLSASDLNKLASKAKKSGDSLLSKRVNLAKTFAKMRKAKGGEVEYAKGGKVEITPKAKQIPKELEKASKMHKSQAERLKKMGFKDGGHINLGKGVKAKRKYREAIGWESDKIFDKKAEKDYKKGDTGYKNYKGEKSVTPVEMSLGGFLGKVGKIGLGAGKGFLMSGGNPIGAVVGGAKGAMDVKAEDDQKAQEKRQIEAKAQSEQASKMSQAGKELASGEVELKHGGDVKQSKEDLELQKFLDFHFPKGKKVETDPEKKAWEAISKEKGSVEPVKMETGGIMKKLTSGDSAMGTYGGGDFLVEKEKKKKQRAIEIGKQNIAARKAKAEKDKQFRADKKAMSKGEHQQFKDPDLKKAIVDRIKKKKEPSFKQDFAKARDAGKTKFKHKGKEFHTRTKEGGVHDQFDEEGHKKQKAFQRKQEIENRPWYEKLGTGLKGLTYGKLTTDPDKVSKAEKEYDTAKQGHAQSEANRLGRAVKKDGYSAKPQSNVQFQDADLKKSRVQKGKSDDRVKQIRAQLKGLVRPDKKYSKKEGIAKAKLYKELAALGKPSKFGKYWMKTYLKDGGSVSFKDVLSERQKYKKGGKVKEYQKDLKKEVGGMSHKGKDFLKKLLKKK